MRDGRRTARRPTLRVLIAGLLTAGGIVVPVVAQAAAPPAFVQGQVFSTAAKTASNTVTLGAVGAGDLLVGWFAQFNAPGQVSVSDNVNGAWQRAPGATTFQNETGDIALYYLPNAKAAASVSVTMSASAPAFFQGAVAAYRGVEIAGPLDRIATGRDIGTAVDTGATNAVGAGELVYSAVITGGNPASITGGSSAGVAYTPRTVSATGASYQQDITSSAAGAQHGTATLGASTDWYAVAAVFRPTSPPDATAPSTPGTPHATSVASSRVSFAWTGSTDNIQVTGYTVYRNGVAIGLTDPATLSFIDSTVTAGTAYTYTVDAFDGAGNHSARSPGLAVTTPAAGPKFVQGVGNSPGVRAASATLALGAPVAAGDLLVGWFGQFTAAGTVVVGDPVNGAWTRSASTMFSNGAGDIALYYVQNAKAAAAGLTVTIKASSGAAAYLPGALAEYSGVATSGALDQVRVGSGIGTAANAGPTAAVPTGELVVSGLITGQQPLTVTPGTSQSAPYTLDVVNGSRSTDIASILSSAAGGQSGPYTLARSMDWYDVVVTFRSTADPIVAYYQQLGGALSYLGLPVGAEFATPGGGRAQNYVGGAIYWSPGSGAHAVKGAILAKYQALGGPGGLLGYPTTDETATPDGIGRYNHFTGSGGLAASIYWTSTTGAHEVHGVIRQEWAATGWERGPLGYPTTDETVTPDGIGRYNHFTGHGGWAASIYWTPATGAHEIQGAIRAKWASLGWERSALGYPTSDEFAVTGGRRSNFQHGNITWIAATGALIVTIN